MSLAEGVPQALPHLTRVLGADQFARPKNNFQDPDGAGGTRAMGVEVPDTLTEAARDP